MVFPFLLGILGVGVVLFATAPGVGLSPDSLAYIGSAQGVLQGRGVGIPDPNGGFRPLLLHAPLFPILLAAVGLFGIEPIDAARHLNSVLFGVSIFLSGLITYRATRSQAAAAIASGLFLLSVPMLKVHSMAWTEPTFIFLTLLVLSSLVRYLEVERIGWLIAAAAAAGLACLTRYAGLFLIPAGVAVVLGSARRRRVRSMVRDAALFAGIAGILSGTSFLRNWLIGGRAHERSSEVHLITAAHFQRAVRALGRWLWMDASPGIQAVLVLALAAVAWRFGTHLHARRNVPTHNQAGHPDSPDPITRTVATLILAYFLFLALVISFHDSTFALDERMLSPILPWSLIAFVCIGHRLTLDRIRASTIYALFAFVALWFAAAQVSRGVPWLMAAHSDGQGYASRQWRESELLARVRALPPKARIFSNAYDAIYLVTGRFADALPQNTVLGTTQVNQHYVDELARMHYWLVKSGGVIVYFSNLEAPTGMASPAELEKMMRLQLLYNAADGAIYGIRE